MEMRTMDRKAMLTDYRNAYKQITEFMKQVPPEMWDFKPGSDKWSIKEILIHLADSEVNGYARCRKILAEEGSELMIYDQDKWAKALDYGSQDIDMAMIVFKTMREVNYRLLDTLTEDQWKRSAFHPDRGRMTLDDWLKLYTEHVKVHIEQMRRNIAAFEEKNRPKSG